MGLPRRLLGCFKPPSLVQRAQRQGGEAQLHQEQRQQQQQHDEAGTLAARPGPPNSTQPREGMRSSPATPAQHIERDLPPAVPEKSWAVLSQLPHEQQDCCPMPTCTTQDQSWRTARRVLNFNQVPGSNIAGPDPVSRQGAPASVQPDVLHSIVAALQPICAPNPERFRRSTTEPNHLDNVPLWDADCAAYMTQCTAMPSDQAPLSCCDLARYCSVPEPATPMAATAATRRALDHFCPCDPEYVPAPMCPPPAPRRTSSPAPATIWMQPTMHNAWASFALQQAMVLLEPAPVALFQGSQECHTPDNTHNLAAGLMLTPVQSEAMSPTTPSYAMDQDMMGTWGSDVGSP